MNSAAFLPPRRFGKWIVSTLTAATVTACSPNPTQGTQQGQLLIGVAWSQASFSTQAIPSETVEIKVKITGKSIPEAQPILSVFKRTPEKPEESLTLTLPVGEKQISVNAMGPDGAVLAEGQSQITIIAGQKQKVELELTPTIRPTPTPSTTDASPIPSATPTPASGSTPAPRPQTAPSQPPSPQPSAGASPPPTPLPSPTPVLLLTSVRLTQPANNSRSSLGSNISLAAELIQPPTDFQRVEFYAGSKLVGTATTAPYSAMWNTTSETPGDVSVKAIAKNALGQILFESPPVVINLFTSSGASGTAPVQAPLIQSFTPTSHKEGTTVTITGTNFGPSPTVAFNGIPATVSAITATSLQAVVPVGATTGPITVSNSEGTNTTASLPKPYFVVLTGNPAILRFTPKAGYSKTHILVEGSNFSTYPEDNTVLLAGVPAVVKVATPTTLVATIDGAASQAANRIQVTTNFGTGTSGSNFTLYGSGVGFPVGLDTTKTVLTSDYTFGINALTVTTTPLDVLGVSGGSPVFIVGETRNLIANTRVHRLSSTPLALTGLSVAMPTVPNFRIIDDLAVDSDDRRALVPMKQAITNMVTLNLVDINLANPALVATLPLGVVGTPIRVTAAADSNSYFMSHDSVINVVNNAVSAFSTTPGLGFNPAAMKQRPQGDKLYVIDVQGGSLQQVRVMNAAVNPPALIGGIPLEGGTGEARAIEITPNGKEAWVTWHNGLASKAIVLNLDTDTIAASIPLTFGPTLDIALSPDGQRAYVLHVDTPLADAVAGYVTVLNVQTRTIVNQFTLNGGVFGSRASRCKVSPDGNYLLITDDNKSVAYRLN